MRRVAFDRAQFSDRFDVQNMVLTLCRSIASSRKRKLRELFAVATDEDGIPNFDFSDPGATPATPAEQKFLNDSDVLQYVALFLNTYSFFLRHQVASRRLTIFDLS